MLATPTAIDALVAEYISHGEVWSTLSGSAPGI